MICVDCKTEFKNNDFGEWNCECDRHRKVSYVIDNQTTHRLFWECECDNNFVHLKSTYKNYEIGKCPVCGMTEEDSPDARLIDVLDYLINNTDLHN